MQACFIFLSFLLNKFLKNPSNSLLISTELSISLLSISNFLTKPCVVFVFSRFRKKFGWFFTQLIPLTFTPYFNAFSNIIINLFKLIFTVIYSTEFMSQFTFDSKKFSLFLREYCLLFFAFAKSFENLTVKQQISYFNYFHFTWSQNWLLQFISPLFFLTSSLSLDTYSSK